MRRVTMLWIQMSRRISRWRFHFRFNVSVWHYFYVKLKLIFNPQHISIQLSMIFLKFILKLIT